MSTVAELLSSGGLSISRSHTIMAPVKSLGGKVSKEIANNILYAVAKDLRLDLGDHINITPSPGYPAGHFSISIEYRDGHCSDGSAETTLVELVIRYNAMAQEYANYRMFKEWEEDGRK